MVTNNFFDLVDDKIDTLNKTEKKLFDYVIKHMDEVKQMSIREFSQTCYISTATIFRFVKKLGFSGYKEFVTALRLTDMSRTKAVIPNVMRIKGYREDYLKNLIETMRVIRKDQVKRIHDRLRLNPVIYLFSAGLSVEAARYIEHLFLAYGYRAFSAYKDYQIQSAIEQITDNDLVFAMSYSGRTKTLVDALEKIHHKCQPLLISITRSDNSMVHALTDMNFYFFADEISYNGFDLTSRVAMICIVEVILYEMFYHENGEDTEE